ncbi:hypothetical protein [Dyadobacter arcticus]|uniref:Uncharacterized protein n=1 Tax=Dyadobacter arcticus TaxID=1078754 RepID=A0ABX0UH24_9BACT|nr:hypothetical protein [Dyadobacter arcticus]NIJ52313.1 hypothetical protein [Dyadobacter arcticus]
MTREQITRPLPSIVPSPSLLSESSNRMNGFCVMRINKEILIDLFERKDKKRRKILYELYSEMVQSSLSAYYVAEMICSDLGRPELVDADDVRYCRFYFRKKPKPLSSLPVGEERPLSSPAPKRERLVTQEKVKDLSKTVWSDGETMDMQDNFFRGTKLGKKNET